MEQRSEPWVAPSGSSRERSAPLRLSVAERSETTFVLAAKEGRVAGSFRVARGELETDLYDLGQTRGSILVDLASVMIEGADGGDDRMAAETAQNWLAVGASVPEAEREKLRWARFRIERVEHLRVRAPQQGRRPRGPARASAGAPSVGGAEMDEVRESELDAVGKLLVHGYEVELRVPVTLLFHYQGEPAPGRKPTRVDIATRSAIPVLLDAHDIRPRDSAGNLLARDLRLLGTKIGREASVSARLTTYPAP